MNIRQAQQHSETIKMWSDAGMLDWFGAFSFFPCASRYKAAGFTSPTEAAEWKMSCSERLEPQEMIEWRDAGFTPSEAMDWSRNFTPKTAAQRRAAGYTSRKITSKTMRTR